MYVFSMYADCGEFEILRVGSEIAARDFFQSNLDNELKQALYSLVGKLKDQIWP